MDIKIVLPLPQNLRSVKRSVETEVGFVVTVGSEGSRSDAQKRVASEIVYGLLSNSSKRRRQTLEARGASPSMRERRNLTGKNYTLLERLRQISNKLKLWLKNRGL